jgi:hypothetical protein
MVGALSPTTGRGEAMEPQTIELAAEMIKTLAIVGGVVISVLSYQSGQRAQARARQVEAARPLMELRQRLYGEALRAAAVLANPNAHSQDEILVANKRFRSLYVAELSMVEPPEVEREMWALASEIAPDLLEFTPAQNAAYELAHVLRDSFAETG